MVFSVRLWIPREGWRLNEQEESSQQPPLPRQPHPTSSPGESASSPSLPPAHTVVLQRDLACDALSRPGQRLGRVNRRSATNHSQRETFSKT